MVAAFVRAEYASHVNYLVRQVVDCERIDEAVILRPDTSDAEENLARGSVLAQTRGYPNRYLFERYPESIRWVSAALSLEDLRRVRYIDLAIWTELSGSSRKASDAAERLAPGRPRLSLSKGAANNVRLI